jgi:hypothetical protein
LLPAVLSLAAGFNVKIACSDASCFLTGSAAAGGQPLPPVLNKMANLFLLAPSRALLDLIITKVFSISVHQLFSNPLAVSTFSFAAMLLFLLFFSSASFW